MEKLLYKDIYPAVTGAVGLELEVEPILGQTLPDVDTTWWFTERDNSLRNDGKEYITKKPLPIDNKKLERITRLTKVLEAAKVNTKCPRTSVHVHCNISDFTVMGVWTAIAASWLFDSLLLKYCGSNREGNLFCLRLTDAEAVTKYAAEDIESRYEPFSFLNQEILKYSSINIASIRRRGSIEFRGMEGTIDPERIDTWSSGLYNLLRKAAETFNTPEELLDYYYKVGPSGTLNTLLSGDLLKFTLNIPKYSDLVDRSAMSLLSFAYETNWRKYEQDITQKFKKKKIAKDKLQEATFNATPRINWDFLESDTNF